MPDHDYPVETVGGVLVVTAPEEIDITNADGLRAALREAAGPGHGRVVLDMTGTRFCDTAGLQVLVHAHKQALSGGGQLRLVVADANILRIFAITGVDRVISHFASLGQALAAAPGPAQAP